LGLTAFRTNPQYQQILQAERDSLNAMSYNEMLSANFKTMEAIAMSSAQTKAQAASLKESQVAGYRERASKSLSLVGRITLVELAVAGFGIVVALIALLNSEPIAGLRVEYHIIYEKMSNPNNMYTSYSNGNQLPRHYPNCLFLLLTEISSGS
jgi:hypothetical protein